VITAVLIFVPTVKADSGYSFQVGAYGDGASQGNLGVQVEIRTHIYDANPGDFDYFWVGDDLANGAFIQFGYSFSPGEYCLQGEMVGGQVASCPGGSATIGVSDARWQWEYWPDENGNTNYIGIGPSNSVGFNGTWHSYSITPNMDGGWDFVLDGQTVASAPFQPSPSKNAAYFVAEKVTPSIPENLGPVEFRNLAYLTGNGWDTVRQLYALYDCGMDVSCAEVNPYGVSVAGSNDIVAGSGLPAPAAGVPLWSGDNTLTLAVPESVNIMIDGSYYGTGPMQISLTGGEHNLSVPELITINANTRLRFDRWNDGLTAVNRTVNLSPVLSLQADYVPQYKLTIDSSIAASGEGWYDQGSTAQVDAPQSQPIIATLGWWGGEMNFGGWYESGKLVTNSPSTSIVMNESHDLKANWVPYPMGPALLTVLVIIGSAVLAYREKRTRVKEIAIGLEAKRLTAQAWASRWSGGSSVEAVLQEPVQSRNTRKCQYCGAEVPLERIICSQCQMPT